MAPVVRDRDLLVLELASILKEVRQIGGDVQDIFNAKLFQNIQVSGILGTAQVEIRKDLHRERRLVVGQGAAVRVCGTVRITVNVRFDV